MSVEVKAAEPVGNKTFEGKETAKNDVGKLPENDTAKRTRKRVTRPDRDAFTRKTEELEALLATKTKQVEEARAAIQQRGNGPNATENSEMDELRAELKNLRQKQTVYKNTKGKVFDEIKAIDYRVKDRVKSLQAAKSKINYRSEEEVDNQIAKLEASVASGSLKVVEEVKSLAEVSALKKIRRYFADFDKQQAAIDEDKRRAAALRASVDDAEGKALNARYTEIKTRMDAITEANQKVMKKRNEMYQRRGACEKSRAAVLAELRAVKDEFYGQQRAFKEFMDNERSERLEREKAEKEAAEAEKKRLALEARLESASVPAFATQITLAQSLLKYFGASADVNNNNSNNNSSSSDKTDLARVQVPEGVVPLKKSPDLGNDAPTRAGSKQKKKDAKNNRLVINMAIIENLAEINVPVPSSGADVPATIEKIRSKIEYYQANEARVTQERINRAKEEIAKLEIKE